MLKNGNVTLMVSDLERAVRFYRDKLGLALVYRAGDDWAQLAMNGLTVGLHPRRPGADAPQPQGQISLGFEVDHLDQAMKALRAKGIEFAPETQDDPGARIAFFSDPDGTPLYLIQLMRSGGPEGWN
jgi:catechol 2,3-dioxygenase-like lactoylglutathione lyase family enzyme